MSLESMRLIYFSYFHSIISYGIIFWSNSLPSKFLFRIQKRTIRVITNSGIRESCRELFKKLQKCATLQIILLALFLRIAQSV